VVACHLYAIYPNFFHFFPSFTAVASAALGSRTHCPHSIFTTTLALALDGKNHLLERLLCLQIPFSLISPSTLKIRFHWFTPSISPCSVLFLAFDSL